MVTALAELSNNIALGDDYQISDEIIQAINLVYQARGKGYNYGDRVSDFARQLNLFPNEDGESVADYNNALVMLLSDILNDKRVTRLKKFLELYNHNAALSAAGQLDIFTGDVKTKEDIIKEVLQLLDYGTEEEQQQASAEAREQRKQSVANTQGDSSEEVSNSNESNEGNGPKGKLATDIREQQRREQILPNLGGKYSLSQEKANNGEVFYQNENGNTTLAIIPDEIFDRLGIKPIPFKLTETMGWHVFDHHKKEAKFNNIGDAIDFVLSIINNVDHVRLGRDNTYIFSVENGRSRVGKRAVTIMINSETGEFMGIRTSGYETLGKLIERPLLWERGADFVPEDVATPTITTIESQQGDETSSRAKSQSNDVSADKDKTSSANEQGNEEKSVNETAKTYDDLYKEAEAEINEIASKLNDERTSADNDSIIQQIADIYGEYDEKLEDGEDLTIEEKARYDAAAKWLNDNVWGEGEGMKGFYDKMLPSFMNKYGKKWGVKVEEVTLPNVEESARKMWSVDVTPEMKESVMQGQPMFLRGGAVQLTPQEVALRDAIVDLMDSYGQRVITDDVMGQSVIDYVNGEETSLSKAQKRALETAVPEDNTSFKATVVSSADGAKILKDLGKLAKDLDNLTTKSKTL